MTMISRVLSILHMIIFDQNHKSSTYGHSQLKTGHPVRSAIHKQLNGRLVLRWVTTWESLLLYVLSFARNSFALEGLNTAYIGMARLPYCVHPSRGTVLYS